MDQLEQVYGRWRSKYLRSYQDGYYIYYKEEKERVPEMTCSEAHGYGMLISVLKRNHDDFNGLYRYFVRFKNRKGLMQWQQKVGPSGQFVPGDEGGENCATDGDVDICTALFLAAKVWGSGGQSGGIDYRKAAEDLAGSIWQHCINHDTYMPLVGDWADPGDKEYLLTRPSDFMLSGYLILYEYDTQRKAQWLNVINAIVDTCKNQLQLNSGTGLIADFLVYDKGRRAYYPAKGEVLESKHDGKYNWNSCRVPWRLAHYYQLTRDQRILPLLQTEGRFFSDQLRRSSRDSCGIKAGYSLDGRCLADYTDMAFVAPVSFLFWTLGQKLNSDLQNILGHMNSMDENTYFGETIAMLCVLEAYVSF